MVFGIAITPILLLLGGLTVLTLLVLEMLIGYRKIHFQGRAHLVWHKRTAWALAAVAVIHGTAGLIFATGLKIG